MTPVETVCKHLGEAELLAQLAEEATELAKAALKLRRVVDGTNYTPVNIIEAEACLLEEIADVKNSLVALDFCVKLDWDYASDMAGTKMARWAARLEAVRSDKGTAAGV